MQMELSKHDWQVPYRALTAEGTVHENAAEAWEFARSREDSFIHDLFEGQRQSTTKCTVCGTCTHSFDDMMEVDLRLPDQASTAGCTLEVSNTFNLLWQRMTEDERLTNEWSNVWSHMQTAWHWHASMAPVAMPVCVLHNATDSR